MNTNEFTQNIRQELREEGFMPGVKLERVIAARAREFGVAIDPEDIIAHIPCEDIHTVEYTNWIAREYRRASLYYYAP